MSTHNNKIPIYFPLLIVKKETNVTFGGKNKESVLKNSNKCYVTWVIYMSFYAALCRFNTTSQNTTFYWAGTLPLFLLILPFLQLEVVAFKNFKLIYQFYLQIKDI